MRYLLLTLALVSCGAVKKPVPRPKAEKVEAPQKGGTPLPDP